MLVLLRPWTSTALDLEMIGIACAFGEQRTSVDGNPSLLPSASTRTDQADSS
jgi:hypothetical protein